METRATPAAIWRGFPSIRTILLSPSPPLTLRCATVVRLGDAIAARACLTNFRRRHPGSAHDAEALALLAGYATSCADARPLLKEYLRRYARGAFADDARDLLTACCDDCR